MPTKHDHEVAGAVEEDGEEDLGDKYKMSTLKTVPAWMHQEAHRSQRTGTDHICRHERSSDYMGSSEQQVGKRKRKLRTRYGLWTLEEYQEVTRCPAEEYHSQRKSYQDDTKET